MAEHKCDECGKEFNQLDFFTQHVRDKHQLPVCPVCGDLYYDERGVIQHKKAKHGVLRPFLRKRIRNIKQKQKRNEDKLTESENSQINVDKT